MAKQATKGRRPPKDDAKRKSRKPQSEAPAQGVSEVKRPRGNQTIYTREIADRICQQLAEGMTLNQICRQPGMPARPTVLLWAREDRDGFADRYAQARDFLIDHWADEAIDIADDGSNDFMERLQANGDTKIVFSRDHVERSKLRVDTRKWMLTKLAPQKYGDKIEQTHKADAAFLAIWQQMGGGQSKKAG